MRKAGFSRNFRESLKPDVVSQENCIDLATVDADQPVALLSSELHESRQ